METTKVVEAGKPAASNVRDLQAQRQQRAARRMAMQAIILQYRYPYLFGVIRYV